MTTKKIYYGKAIYGKEEINASMKVLKNNSLSLMDGINVKKLENAKLYVVRTIKAKKVNLKRAGGRKSHAERVKNNYLNNIFCK